MIGSATRSIFSLLSLLLIPIVVSLPVIGGELTQLVTDLNPSLSDDDPSGGIVDVLDGTLYFTKDSQSYGAELWKSDGTAEGTKLVKDFVYGSDSGGPEGFVKTGDSLYFWAKYDRNHILSGLWKSDGTEEGSSMLTSNWPATLVPFGGKIYYLVGGGLALTDGTVEGTVTLSSQSGVWDAAGLTAIGGNLYFNANSYSDSMIGLWKSDGTAAGTVLVKQLSQVHSAAPFAFTEWNAGTYFTASFREGSNAPLRQLWKTDGTASGTVRIDSLGTSMVGVERVIAGNGALFFTTSDGKLWKTDGSEAGTVLVKAFGYGNKISAMQMVGATLCLQTNPQSQQFALWGSDGTEAGTVEIGSFSSGYESYNLPPMMPHDGKLYFQGDGAGGEGLYVTDGTTANTRLLYAADFGGDVVVAPQSYRSTELGLFFQAAILKLQNGEFIEDFGIYVTDGTEGGTRLFVDLDTGTESSQIDAMISVGDQFYFIGKKDFFSDTKLWRTDGSAAGTEEIPLHIEWTGGLPFDDSVASRNGNLYFRGYRQNSEGEWDYGIMMHDDSTNVTTRVLALPAPDPFKPISYELPYFTFLGSRTAFIADKTVHLLDETTGLSEPLLQTDGVGALTTVGGKLYFSARVAGSTWRIWESDGTSAGTRLIPQNSSSGASFSQTPMGVSKTNGDLYFTEGNPYIQSLHRTNGTPGGTLRLATLERIGKLHEAGAKIFFLASTEAAGRELWVTDGTAAGTRMVKNITAGSAGTFSYDDPGAEMAVLGNRIYFFATTPSYGDGLWTSDGTEAGTYLLKDIFPGGTTYLSGFTLFHGKLLFTADDGVHGREIWECDGTASGTCMLADVTGDSASSSPLLLTPHGDDLYFTAYTEEYRRELFIYSEGNAAAPVAEIVTVSAITKTSAIVNSLVAPNRANTSAILEYGTTPAFGSSLPIPLLPKDGRGPQPHSISLQNLLPATTYYFRLSAENSLGSDQTSQGSFITLENLPPVHPPELRFVYHETKLEIAVSDLLAGALDPDGDRNLIRLSAIGDAVSGKVLRNGSEFISYTPNAGFSGKDLALVTFTDGEGASSTAQLEFIVGGPFGDPFDPSSATTRVIFGPEQVHFLIAAVPGKNYLIQRSADLEKWDDLATQISIGASIDFVDDDPPKERAFYRTKYLGSPTPDSGE